MESLGGQSVNNIKNCNEGTSKIDVLYTDSNLKSVPNVKELDLCSFDHRNGSVDLHCKIQSTDGIDVEKSFVVNEHVINVDYDKVNLSEDTNSGKNSHESNEVLKSQIKLGESVSDDPLYLANHEDTESKTKVLEDQLTSDDPLFTCNIETRSSELPSSTLCLNETVENNVNITDESLFEDVNKYSVTDSDSHENSLQDPLFIGDLCLPEKNVQDNDKCNSHSQLSQENTENLCTESESPSRESSQAQEVEDEIPSKNDLALPSEAQENNLTEEDVNRELEAILAPQSHNIVVGYGEEAILITNLSVPPPVQLVTKPAEENLSPSEELSISRADTVVPAAKKLRLDTDFEDFPPLNSEGKATLLKILPIKNGHGLWNIEELKMVLEDRGSILLRLCAAPEAGNEDIIDGPKADFTALLIDESLPIINNETMNDVDLEEDLMINQSSLFDRLSDFSSLNEEYNPPFWKHQIKEARIPSVPKRKRSTPKSSTPGAPPRGGRKRGRPPLTNRAWIPKMKFSTTLPDEPIKFRPPTPPSVANGDGSSKSMGILEAALSKSPPYSITRKLTPESLVNEPTSSAAALDDGDTIPDEDSIDTYSDEIDDTGKPIPIGGKLVPVDGYKNKKFVIKIPCPHCHMQFRKKAALTGHMKLRHKMLRKCPICHESIKIKGKLGIKNHINKVHKDEKNFPCDDCPESYTMLHHLKNHRRFIHNSVASSDDEDDNEGECSESEEVTSAAEGKERLSAEKETKTKNTPEKESKQKNAPEKQVINTPEQKPVPTTRTTRSGIIVCEVNKDNSKIDQLHNSNKASNSKPKGDDNDDEEDRNSDKSVAKGPTRTLRSQISAINTRKVSPRNVGKEKEHLNDRKQDLELLSENENETDDEDEPESDVEVEKMKYICDLCDESFIYASKLKEHKNRKHSNRPSLRNKPNSNNDLHSGELSCRICKKKCRSENQLKLHVLAQHKPSNEKAKGMNSTRAIVSIGRRSTDKEDTDGEEDEQVNKCSKKSKIPPYIVRRGRIYFCNKCSLSFKREKQMMYHLKKIHEALYPFRKCPDCPRVFRSSGPFIRHLREHKSSKCPVDGCKAKYKVLRLIKKHQRHSHPKLPHRCTRCVALFAKEHELDLHSKEVHQISSRRSSKDGDDDDVDDEEEEEEEEEEEDEEDEEEEEIKPKIEINKKGSKESKVTPHKKTSPVEQKKAAFIEDSSHVRRTRTVNISYKEDEDEEEILPQKIPMISPIKKSINILPDKLVSPRIEVSNLEVKKPAFISQSNPLKNLREAIMMQNASKAKKPQPPIEPKIEGTAESIQPYVKPKRRYVRKAPYKKRKVDNSWTAALKAQYEGFSPDSNDRKYVSMSSTPSLNTNPMYSPGITADVVRRVAESLLNKHQEQQQKQQMKLQKKQYKQLQQQQKRNQAFINYNAKSKHLPRIAYSSVIGSRDNSLSSFDDSSHADGGDYYGTGSSSTSRISRVVVPDNDGPDKVLRFDNF